MDKRDVIYQLNDLIRDRQSFADRDGGDSVFAADVEALQEAIRIIEGGVTVSEDIKTRIGKLPPLDSTIQAYGQPAKVCGYKITADADYIVLNDGRAVHVDNLDRNEGGGKL